MKVGFVSLGCSKNLVDTEMCIGLFKKHKYEVVSDTPDDYTGTMGTTEIVVTYYYRLKDASVVAHMLHISI